VSADETLTGELVRMNTARVLAATSLGGSARREGDRVFLLVTYNDGEFSGEGEWGLTLDEARTLRDALSAAIDTP
jgi:hypothetical protein